MLAVSEGLVVESGQTSVDSPSHKHTNTQTHHNDQITHNADQRGQHSLAAVMNIRYPRRKSRA
jgi:hypothetical protein